MRLKKFRLPDLDAARAAVAHCLHFAQAHTRAMSAPDLDLYPEYVHVRLDDAKSMQELAALLVQGAERCTEKSMLGALWEIRSSRLNVCLGLATALDAMSELWQGSQRRLALLCAHPDAEGACWYASLLAARRSLSAQRFDSERAALEWLVGPGAVPGRLD